ncbi:MAG: exodeoxyribonuclease V subunit gamma [Proteobacteria bacterium]|nr:exodeoxyribonuclease V subunit gamma [Pseudomonadota bacterium]MBU1738098.1 exodeoxyribonuclease V subunit gamma [Pseudomonadota bacterium]
MALHLYSSNRLEILADAFSRLVTDDPLPPMLPETVVLQSGGMARWLSMQIAGKTGICANLDCPFPNQFVDRVFRKVLGGEDFSKVFDRDILQWQLMKVLPPLLSEPGFEILKRYLQGAGGVKMFRLAGRLADLYDQYTIYRPEMILAWERGAESNWQARLWRYLQGRDDCQRGVIHRAGLHGRCLAAIHNGTAAGVFAQGRFSVFGLSSIPPYHLDIMTALSATVDIHFFFMNPCREYWDDIVSGKRINKLAVGFNREPEELHLVEGNSLLASTGRQGRELITLLHERGEWQEHDLFVDPVAEGSGATALEMVQADILHLRSGPDGECGLTGGDGSLQFHSCHSPMRELEVLYDQILKMFADDPDLRPRDILVMMPDIEAYSPLIQAVFSVPEEGVAIPYSIADRKLGNEGVLVRAVQDIFDLGRSRFEVSRVLGILEHDAVLRKFGFSGEDFARIESWLADVNVRWGIDPESKVEMGLPGTVDNTWRQGLDRLLLGYAMAGNGSRVFADILPADNIEGNESEILGRFIEFTEKLFLFTGEIRQQRDLAGWSELLADLLQEMIEPEIDRQQEFSLLVRVIASLAEKQAGAEYRELLDFDVVRSCLDHDLAQGGLSTGFLTGAVTFCELLPMRAVPCKCICLLGMNEGAFPRIGGAPGFDLIAANPRLGDRSKKNDDRYLFLETLLSARKILYISFVGQSNKDGGTRLPSALVSELLDGLKPCRDQAGNGRADPVLRHPMHGFSRKYFDGSDARLISYGKDGYRAASALSAGVPAAPLLCGDLPLPPDIGNEIDLQSLLRFFRRPAEYFCRNRLGLEIDRNGHDFESSESFSLGGLDRYQAGSWLLDKLLSGSAPDDSLDLLRLSGILPHGSVGRAESARLRDEVSAMADRVKGYRSAANAEAEERVVEAGGWRVTGSLIADCETGRQVIYRFAAITAEDRVSGWLKHLFFNCLPGKSEERQTVVVGIDKTFTLDTVDNSREILAELLEIYRDGTRKIVRFFPKASFAFAEKLAEKGEEAAFARAKEVWRGSDFSRGEGGDPYYKLCFRETDPFDREFAEIAIRFFGPLLEQGGRR